MKTNRFWRWGLRAILIMVLFGAALFAMSGSASAGSKEKAIRWDIVSVDFATGTLNAGGIASATAIDGSMITLTGHGTFVPGDGFGNQEVTGGGTWQTFDPSGTPTASGTYKVTGFVRWTAAPGTPPLPNDNIGEREDQSAGLVFVAIRYSNGSTGVLTVSCHLVGSPNSIFEGIRVSMGFVDYWNGKAPPAPPGNANRTNFHILDED